VDPNGDRESADVFDENVKQVYDAQQEMLSTITQAQNNFVDKFAFDRPHDFTGTAEGEYYEDNGPSLYSEAQSAYTKAVNTGIVRDGYAWKDTLMHPEDTIDTGRADRINASVNYRSQEQRFRKAMAEESGLNSSHFYDGLVIPKEFYRTRARDRALRRRAMYTPQRIPAGGGLPATVAYNPNT